ncbi:hypothetical protein CEP52_000278 [Fusarium oligoseptatum]|uniref:FAM192A/Fyv6 N-terminal domain-containing protein n=1 Tax=Fusarium oligoseptatum TaxID=2604345 RepID=A0A428UQN2_9HYPO|nr:hypothetical protein CEP52_000278 [Fusarium oligoseptatum]
MSNRFVSAGTIGSSGEISKDTGASAASTEQPLYDSAKNKEWEAVQKELDAERRRREEQRVKAATGEAAKQAAFEEQTKLRNQFRALDDDEIEFLDEIRANKRAEEERVRRETEEGLKAFRERQKGDAGEKPQDEPAAEGEGESWGVGRKRKRVKERDVKGLRRKVSAVEEDDKDEEPAKQRETEVKKKQSEEAKVPESKVETSTKPPEKKGLGLVGYGSDSDSDD